MTVSKNLNDVTRYIVPLLDDHLVLDDISEESGFVNAYTEDINRPYLYDNVFLMYKSKANTMESMNRYRKFKQLDTIHNTKYIKIKNEHYTVYTFNKVKYRKDIRDLLIGGECFNLQAKQNISSFWGSHAPSDLTFRLFLPQYRIGEPIKAILPEEDFYPYEL